MIILSVDYGKVRTGTAVSDAKEMFASPLKTIVSEEINDLVCQIAELAEETKAQHIVIGYPKNMDGTIGERAQQAEVLAKNLEETTNLPASLWDERLTTVSAHRVLNETNVRGKKRKDTVDMVAAVMILESFLTYRKNHNQ